MIKADAERLLWFVNDPDCRAGYEFYVDNRVSLLRERLETCKDHNTILEIQGAIQELKRFLTLRDEVLVHKKD